MTQRPKQDIRPDKFSFHIGGATGICHALEMYESKLLYFTAYSELMRGNGAGTEIAPSPVKWCNFITKLDVIGVWDWETTYNNPGVCDGTQWELEIVIGDRKINSRGSNNYPGIVDDPECIEFHSSSPQFDAFLSALRNLTGKKIN